MAAPIFRIQNEALTTTLWLYDANSVGNAIPTRQVFRDLDIRQNYANGDTGKIPIRLAHEFVLSMDYVTAAIREQLTEWKFDRERCVLYNDTGETDAVAVNLMETCKGRLYEITAIPSIPLIQDGFTAFMGDIIMRQVWYTGTGVISYATDV